MHAITGHRIVCVPPHWHYCMGHTMKSGPSDSGIQRRVRQHNGQRRPPNACPAKLQGHKDKSIFCIFLDTILDLILINPPTFIWCQQDEIDMSAACFGFVPNENV